jgi:hypothetical protein
MSNPPEGTVRAVFVRNYDTDPREGGGLLEADSAIKFQDGTVMLFVKDGNSHSLPGIILTRKAIYALKARG